MVNDVPIDEAIIIAIDKDLEEPRDMWDDRIHHTDQEQIPNGEYVILDELGKGRKVG